MKEIIETIKKSLPPHVLLVAVSKTRTRVEIDEAIKCGIVDFGENRIQELLSKFTPDESIHWHMIGHLQRNKVKAAVKVCSLIQSVDSLALLDEIQKQAHLLKKVMPVLLQVKIADEATKSGFQIKEIENALRYGQQCSHVDIQGFMVIGPHTTNEDEISQVFQSAQKLFLHFCQAYHLSILSMGMSHDYPLAIQAGSTMVRLGSMIFGNRKVE